MKSHHVNKRIFLSRRKGTKEQENRLAEFEDAFFQHYQTVFLVLLRLTGVQEDAEDLAMDTFWRLWDKPPANKENLRGWLLRVALHLGFNNFRSRRRRVGYEQKSGYLIPDENATITIEAQVETNIEQERVRQMLQKMPAKQARILVLRYSGFSYKEIAEAIQVKPGSVGVLLARAEETFEKIFRNGGGNAST